jgi:hypothetical protein
VFSGVSALFSWANSRPVSFNQLILDFGFSILDSNTIPAVNQEGWRYILSTSWLLIFGESQTANGNGFRPTSTFREFPNRRIASSLV